MYNIRSYVVTYPCIYSCIMCVCVSVYVYIYIYEHHLVNQSPATGNWSLFELFIQKLTWMCRPVFT